MTLKAAKSAQFLEKEIREGRLSISVSGTPGKPGKVLDKEGLRTMGEPATKETETREQIIERIAAEIVTLSPRIRAAEYRLGEAKEETKAAKESLENLDTELRQKAKDLEDLENGVYTPSLFPNKD